jgi:hypothetical protein
MFKWLDRLFILIATLAIGFCLGIMVKTYYNYAVKKPNEWVTPPIIVNCLGDDINEETIKRAVDFWDKENEKVYFYQYERIDKICDYPGEKINGMIVLREAKKLKADTLAQTHVFTIGNKIIFADIVFRKDTYNYILLLEHELGHAFGYKHTPIAGHVMHPKYDFMGDKFW